MDLAVGKSRSNIERCGNSYRRGWEVLEGFGAKDKRGVVNWNLGKW